MVKHALFLEYAASAWNVQRLFSIQWMVALIRGCNVVTLMVVPRIECYADQWMVDAPKVTCKDRGACAPMHSNVFEEDCRDDCTISAPC